MDQDARVVPVRSRRSLIAGAVGWSAAAGWVAGLLYPLVIWLRLVRVSDAGSILWLGVLALVGASIGFVAGALVGVLIAPGVVKVALENVEHDDWRRFVRRVTLHAVVRAFVFFGLICVVLFHVEDFWFWVGAPSVIAVVATAFVATRVARGVWGRRATGSEAGAG